MHTPKWGRTNPNNRYKEEGGGETIVGTTETGPGEVTPRRESNLPPSSVWASPQGRMDAKENPEVGVVATIDDEEERPLQGTRLDSKFGSQTSHEGNLVLSSVRIAITGSFPLLKEEDHSILGPAHDLYMGKNFLKQLIVSHGGQYSNTITTSTSFLLIGDCPVRAKMEKAVTKGVRQVRYATFQRIIYGKQTLADALAEPELENTEDP